MMNLFRNQFTFKLISRHPPGLC